jgi:alkanesulfonate monooxygenase SsuD/methylene tetrahydromethanopterin reductase-like flavin-dependent oxidoreductase (luciferase family)
LRAGAARAGRSLADIDVQAGGTVAFVDDVQPLIEARKPGFAFQMGAMGSRAHNFYNEAYQRQGYVELAKTVQALWLDGKHKEAAALIPDDFVLKTNLMGTAEQVKQRICAYREAGVTTLRVQPEGETLDASLATLGRLMDLVAQVKAETTANELSKK